MKESDGQGAGIGHDDHAGRSALRFSSDSRIVARSVLKIRDGVVADFVLLEKWRRAWEIAMDGVLTSLSGCKEFVRRLTDAQAPAL